MKLKILIAAIAATGVALPAAAQAGVTRHEIHRDVRDVHQERRDVARAYASGNPKRIAAEKRELRGARHELREDSRAYAHRVHRHHHRHYR